MMFIYISVGNEMKSIKPDSEIRDKTMSNLHGHISYPLKPEQLAAKFKTFANAKFLSLTNASDMAVKSER